MPGIFVADNWICAMVMHHFLTCLGGDNWCFFFFVFGGNCCTLVGVLVVSPFFPLCY